MKSKTLKQILATTVLASTLLISNAGISNAALQANPNTQYTKRYTRQNWMSYFRDMEKAGGAMGLNEELNDDLTSKTSNKIDVHMVKTTEYGAVAILSASGYGNSNKISISGKGTTTGNETGVILNTSYPEWTAGGGGETGGGYSGVNKRYFNIYIGNDRTSARAGDALGTAATTNPGCDRWHSATSNGWVQDGYSFLRGNGGIFSFNYYGAESDYYSRGVAICGEGL